MVDLSCQKPPVSSVSDLVWLVDLKWLMAGHGHWIDIPRLQQDRCYARSTLDCALGLPSELIRHCAQRSLSTLL